MPHDTSGPQIHTPSFAKACIHGSPRQPRPAAYNAEQRGGPHAFSPHTSAARMTGRHYCIIGPHDTTPRNTCGPHLKPTYQGMACARVIAQSGRGPASMQAQIGFGPHPDPHKQAMARMLMRLYQPRPAHKIAQAKGGPHGGKPQSTQARKCLRPIELRPTGKIALSHRPTWSFAPKVRGLLPVKLPSPRPGLACILLPHPPFCQAHVLPLLPPQASPGSLRTKRVFAHKKGRFSLLAQAGI